MVLATLSGFCIYLVPKDSQDSLDEKVLKLSTKIDSVNLWNFSTIHRDVALSLLSTLFQAKPNTVRFYINVAAYSALLTLVALLPYLFIPFRDPLNVSLFGYERFFLMGFLVPAMIFSVLSMAVTITLLTLGRRIRFGMIYVIILGVDVLVSAVMISALFLNLELTRDYLLALYNGDVITDRWIAFSQPFLALYHVLSHPASLLDAFKAEYSTASKYTTYVLSVAAMICAVLPLLVHTLAALFIVISSIFHDVMKHATSYVLRRANEQKTFKMLAFLFAAPAACMKIAEQLWF